MIRLLTAIVVLMMSLQVMASSSGVQVSNDGLAETKLWAQAVSDSGDLNVVYHSIDGEIYLNTGTSELSLSRGENKRASAGIAMDIQGDLIHVAWREKVTSKKLMYTRSNDGGGSFTDPVMLDTDSEALARLKLTAQDNWVFLTWLGEFTQRVPGKKIARGGQDYNLYFQYSKDYGKTFSETKKVAGGIYPEWIVTKEAVYIVSRAVLTPGTKPQTLVRRFDLATEQWGSVVPIAEVPRASPIFKGFASGNRLFLIWNAMSDGGLLKKQLEGAYSDDEGKTWVSFTFPTLEGYDFGKLETAHDAKGHIYLVGSASKRISTSGTKEDKRLFFIRSADNGDTWDEPQLIRHYDDDHRTKARYPSMAISKDGIVAVGWEDWRNIYAGFYLNISRDNGKTWLEKDVPLETKGLESPYANGRVNSLSFSGEQLHVVVPRFPNYHQSHPVLAAYTLEIADLTEAAKSKQSSGLLDDLIAAWDDFTSNFSDNDSKQKEASGEADLKKRIAEYWTHMINQDHEAAYNLNDPFFKIRNSLLSYRASRGTIKYHSFDNIEVDIKGNVARVALDLEYSISAYMVKNFEMKRDKKMTRLTGTWVFVRDQWYMENYNDAARHTFTRYQ